jgi:hypothetical protein
MLRGNKLANRSEESFNQVAAWGFFEVVIKLRPETSAQNAAGN